MNTATALRESRKLLKTHTIDYIYEIYKGYLQFTELLLITDVDLRKKIITKYMLENDKLLLRFASGLSDISFSFDRFEQYKQFRKIHKTDSNSIMFFKIKYGDNWEEIYNSSKNKRFNMYNVDDYIKRYNMTLDEAMQQVAINKNKTTPSVDKYIQKYGETAGVTKFKQTCRRHKNYIEYWNKLYPDNPTIAEQEFKKYKSESNLKNINYYLKRGHSIHEGTRLISAHQLSTAGVHRSYYNKLGIPENEIDKILKEINTKKDSASLAFITSKFPDLSLTNIVNQYKTHNLTKSSTYRENGYLRKDDPDINVREAYYKEVEYFTNVYAKLLPPCPGIRGKHRGTYQVDHRYSKHNGFQNNIPSHVIGHITNLQWLLVEQNCSKRANCAITKEELLQEYLKYENQNNQTT